jgi:hypothetical protein
MGSTRQHTIRILTTVAAIALAVSACSGRDDDQSADDAAAPATNAAPADAATDAATGAPALSEAEVATDEAAGADASGGAVGGLILPEDAALAIEAHARLRVDDVRRAVDEVRTAVDTAGGRVAAANIAYPDEADDGDDGDDVTATAEASASLTLLVPPDALGGVVDRLEEIGELSSFDQSAEDVTEQLADLDTRIANARASVDRARALLDQATTLQDLVFLEGELTRRETDLELLLASQQQLQDRVAMSTLTLEITERSPAREASVSGRGIVDALADGWDAFVTAVLTVAVGLAAAAPFLLTAAVAFLAFVSLRRWRRAGAEAVGTEHPVDGRAVGEGERRPEAGVGVGVGERERP